MSFEITQHILTTLGKLPKRVRTPVLYKIGQSEFAKCAADPLYWLDANRHDNIPYVYTIDPIPLFTCSLCDQDLSYGQFNF